VKIVVTGALGHIGSKLIRELPKRFQGVEIVLLDNFLTQRYCSLFNLPSYNYKFLEIDITKDNLEPIFIDSDVVIHLAAITDAASSFDKKELVESVNLNGTERVALVCSKLGVPLICPSTTSVYGTQKDVVDESCPEPDLKPQSPYAESKLLMEKMLKKMGEEKGLNFIIFRFGTIFGSSPGMRFHTAVNKFIWQACMEFPITVWETAMYQKRPYLDIEDACHAIEFVINENSFNKETFNVLTMNATVNDILLSIKKCIPNITVNFVNNPIMNQLSYCVSCEKFSSRGFKFIGNLDKSVKDTIKMLDFNHRFIR
jgi:nucleoside-diphosphate-sugar epimerase